PMWRAIRTGKWLRFHGPRFPRQPTSLRITASVDSAHISSNRSFADFEAELQQFTLDLGSTPTGIFFRQAHDQFADLCGDPRSPSTPARFLTPVAAETGPVPADHGVGFDNNQRSE